MRRADWLGVVACLWLSGVVATERVAAADVPAGQPPFPQTASGGGTSVFAEHAPVQDLTPTGFADITPPPDPHPDGPGTPGHLGPVAPGYAGFYGTAEYLLFHPRSGGMDFALENATNGLATSGPIRTLKYDIGNGLRVEGGYRFAAGWDFGIAYTYLQSSGDRSSVAGAGQVLLPTLTRPGLTDEVTSASAHATLNYNVYDILVGKRFVIEEQFAARLFAGFRQTDIRQRFDAYYNGLDAVSAVVNNRSAFTGFGPLVGAEAVLGGWHGLHLYGRASGGLVTGRSGNKLLETNNAGATVYVNTVNNVWKVVPTTSIALGGGWEYGRVSIRAGYEVTHWFGLGDQPRFVDDVARGKLVTRPADLSLEGFFIQLGLTF